MILKTLKLFTKYNGEENEIRTCCKCGIQGSEEDIVEYCGGYFCHHCLKEIEE